MENINKTVRITIKNCNELPKKELDKTLRDIRYLTCKASNKAMQMYYMWENEKIAYKEEHGEYPSEKEMFGKTYRNVVEAEVKKIMNIVNTSNTGQTNAFVMKKWNTDRNDILNYRKTLTNYKLDMPIYLKNSSYKIARGTSGFEVECSLFNREYQKANNIGRLTFTIDKLDGNKKSTLDKIISGEYKQGSAQLVQDKKGKWYINISFGFEAKEKELDINRVLGIDLGITNAVAMQIYDTSTSEWDRLSWKECILDGKELIHFRQKIEARRIGLLKNSKIAEVNTGKAGHGRYTRTKSIDSMSEKVNNYRDTLNHKYSRYIIDFAIKNNCGTIQMENLEGVTSKARESFLKNWSYFDLQSKIEYKADEVGIKVLKVSPGYTSKRCSECGSIHNENRDITKSQSKFECIECGYADNADINAAKNIALPGIDTIIKEQLKTK